MGRQETMQGRKGRSKHPFTIKSQCIVALSLITDSGYDESKVYQTAINHMKPNGKIIIHPRLNAVVSANKKAALRQINQHVKQIQSRGVFEWRKTSVYYQQSKVENSFYRYKTIIGDHLKSRRDHSS